MEPASRIKTPILIGAGILVLVIGAVALFLFNNNPPDQEEILTTIDTGPDIGVQVSGAVETPADKLPGTNPFTDYKNPFE